MKTPASTCRKTFAQSATLLLTISLINLPPSAFAATRYVSPVGSQTIPYTTWATAARDIQTAVDAAAYGDTILVTNGVYATGGRVAQGSLLNRVAIEKAITVRSVNGPEHTVIQGQGPQGPQAMRCAYVGYNAVLSGFTLSGGNVRGDAGFKDKCGAGAFCTSGVITNCWITGNTAVYGGGVYGGTLRQCTVETNSASQCGGGTYGAVLFQCKILGNSALGGGGVYGGTAEQCFIAGNEATNGGGVYGGTVRQSKIQGNLAINYGGGAYDGSLHQCAIICNKVENYGGGTYGGIAINCTITDNTAENSGGSVNSVLKNCIIFNNIASVYPNWFASGPVEYCCTTPLPPGPGNIDNDPGLASITSLASDSPCIGKGKPEYATGTDIHGDPWHTPPSMGCDEFSPGSNKGDLIVNAAASPIVAAVGFPIEFHALIFGQAAACTWDFGDGSILGNKQHVNHAFVQARTYTVKLTAFNETYPQGVSATLEIIVSPQVIHYVRRDNPTPVPPYTNWMTAAAAIQDAVDAAIAGDTVLVTNGTYATGGRVKHEKTLNRVVVDKAITVRSVNGPEFTTIQGQGPLGDAAVRCVYLGADARLIGFTLTGGHTQPGGIGNLATGQSGGGAWCETTAVISNCTITGNSAGCFGGGTYRGSLYQCVVSSNSSCCGGGTYEASMFGCTLYTNTAASEGGGSCASSSIISNCMIIGNSAISGGGIYGGILDRCVLSNNVAGSGGASYAGTLHSCTITHNTAKDSGGGAACGTLFECMLSDNSALFGGGTYSSTVWRCTIASNSARQGGGCLYGELHNSVLSENTASAIGGGAFIAVLNNCTITKNTAPRAGGISSSIANNCIVYHNNAAIDPNYDDDPDTRLTYCCSTPLADGPGNISSDPLLENVYSLQANSPCIGAGSSEYALQTDIHGDPWRTPPSIGCDEYVPLQFDSDLDGMSDAWELKYYRNLTVAHADADPDGDAISNLEESLMDSDPLGNKVRLALGNQEGGNGFVFHWPSETGRKYSVLWCPKLPGPMTVLATNLPATPPINSFTDTVHTGTKCGYYKVKITLDSQQ